MTFPRPVHRAPRERQRCRFDPGARGKQLLSGSSSPVLQMAAVIAASHHERWDGTGYPAALTGQAIPLVGRIVAVADVFDALTHDRPYKSAWPTAPLTRVRTYEQVFVCAPAWFTSPSLALRRR